VNFNALGFGQDCYFSENLQATHSSTRLSAFLYVDSNDSMTGVDSDFNH